jgi:hypothetical protein
MLQLASNLLFSPNELVAVSHRPPYIVGINVVSSLALVRVPRIKASIISVYQLQGV